MSVREEAPLRFAVVGCGVIGRQHAATISALAGARLVAVADSNAAAAAELAAAHDAAAFTDLADVLARTDVDAVSICTPSGYHVEPALSALAAGKHVIVEKPVDVSIAAASRLATASAASDRIVSVISQHRYDPASRAVRTAVQSGQFGTITSAVASVAWWRSQQYYDAGDWRGTWALDGGGALMNQSIHTVDLMIWMLGRPLEVTAYSSCLAHTGIEVEDIAVAIIRFESGALGTIHATTAAYPGLTARLQIHGSRGSAVIDDDQLAYFHAADADDDEAPAYGAGRSSNQASLISGQNNPAPATAGRDPGVLSAAHTWQYTDFLTAVRESRQTLVPVADAVTTLAVVLAIYRSAREQRPIQVDGG